MKNKDNTYDFLFEPKGKNIPPAVGRVLISEPLLQGKYFKRSVILLTEHNKDGSMGLVLNKPITRSVNELIDLFPSCNNPLFIGGPVHTDHLFYIHTLGHKIPQSYPLNNNLFWGGDLDVIQDLLTRGEIAPNEIRFFTGASGWGLGQLQDEIDEKSWVVSILSTDTIMNKEASSLWETAIFELGKDYRHWIHFPENPLLN